MQLNLTMDEGQIILDSLDIAFKAGHPAGLNGALLAASVVSKIQVGAVEPSPPTTDDQVAGAASE